VTGCVGAGHHQPVQPWRSSAQIRAWYEGQPVPGPDRLSIGGHRNRAGQVMDHWGGDHNGLPIFVPSHRPPGPAARWGYPLVTYVTDGIASAMKQAKAAAGNRNVHVVGGYTAQRALEAGVLDELQIHLIPVLLGRGRRLFDVLPYDVELEIVRVIDTPEATHIRCRVRH
jgi:dihydrofolate reductase